MPRKKAENVSGNSRVKAFQDWMTSVGITWQPSIELRTGLGHCSGEAWGIYSSRDIQERELLCTIPKAALLSIRTTAIATSVLAPERLRGGLGLTVAVMYEAGIGAKSKWHGYLSTLPAEGECLPLTWGEGELRRLRGTSLEGRAEEDRAATQADYEEHVAGLAPKYPHIIPGGAAWSLAAFRAAASWVASRAFFVDGYHGDAMVPLADVFNHKASLVALHGGEYEVAEEGCEGSDDEESEDCEDGEEEGEEDGSSGDGQSDDSGSEGEGHEEGEPEHGKGSSHKHHVCGAGCSHDHRQVHSHSHSHGHKCSQEHGGCCDHDHHDHGNGPSHAGDPNGPVQGQEGGRVGVVAAAATKLGLDLRLQIAICSVGDEQEGSSEEEEEEEDSEEEQEEREEGSKEDAAAAQGKGVRGGRSDAHAHAPVKAGSGVPADGCGSAAAAVPQPVCEITGALEIVAASPLPAGAEVHNTYGEHGDAELVAKYGFALGAGANPFSEVELGKGVLLGAAQRLWAIGDTGGDGAAVMQGPAGAAAPKGASGTAGGRRGAGGKRGRGAGSGVTGGAQSGGAAAGPDAAACVMRRRKRFLEHSSGLLDEGEEPACVLPGCAVNLPTYLLLRVLTASEQEFAGWSSVKDVLRGARSAGEASSAGAQAADEGQQGPAKRHKVQHPPASAHEHGSSHDQGHKHHHHTCGKAGCSHEHHEHHEHHGEDCCGHAQNHADGAGKSGVAGGGSGHEGGELDAEAAGRAAVARRFAHEVPVPRWGTALPPSTTPAAGRRSGQGATKKDAGATKARPGAAAGAGAPLTLATQFAGRTYTWTPAMAAVLREVVAARLSQYARAYCDEDEDGCSEGEGSCLEAVAASGLTPDQVVARDEGELARVMKGDRDCLPGSRAATAARAALVLRLAEQRMLMDVLQALP